MAIMSLMPVPPEQTGATCPHCSAPIVSDQRYCLTCGQPCAPVRLAFLDVLQSEQRAPAGSGWASQELGGPIPDGYGSPGDESALQRWLRRYSGVFGVLGVLLLAIVIGLLVGHWVTQGNTPSKQVVEVKGLPTVAAAAAAAPPSTEFFRKFLREVKQPVVMVSSPFRNHEQVGRSGRRSQGSQGSQGRRKETGQSAHQSCQSLPRANQKTREHRRETASGRTQQAR